MSCSAPPVRVSIASFCTEPWRGQFEARPHTEKLVVEDAGILVMDDKPKAVDDAIAAFLRGVAVPPAKAAATATRKVVDDPKK